MKSKKNLSTSGVVKIPRTDPVYNCHGYLTKIPVGAITPFIEKYTSHGDTVVDIFAGSGMTAIAAIMTGRNAKVNDISVLGKHIAEGYITKVNSNEFLESASHVVSKTREKVGDFYQTIRSDDGILVEVVRTIWSSVYCCPNCDQEFIFYHNAVQRNKRLKDICSNCGTHFDKRKWSSNPNTTKKSDVPVKVVVIGIGGKQVEQGIQQYDLDNINRARSDQRLEEIPSLPISPFREMYSRSGLKKKGISETKDFFSARNAIVLFELWRAIQNITNSKIRKKLSFVFTAILPRASKRYQWSEKRPLNAQNQTYYISPVYYEWNVLDLFLRKVNAVLRSDNFIFGPSDSRQNTLFSYKECLFSGSAEYILASADSLDHLQSNSVDYIFTDPPFGSNIFYSDMSLFHEAWLGEKTDNDKEAVIYTTGEKKNNAAERYENLLRCAFKEAYRVLKNGHYMSVVFGNSKGSVWSMVLRALRDAGFESVPVNIHILDKGQRSVKGLNSGSENIVTVDLIITVHKSEENMAKKIVVHRKKANPEQLIEKVLIGLEDGDAKNPSYIYVKVLREAIKQHLLVDDLHLSDVLIALKNKGVSIDSKTGSLIFN